MMVIPSRSILRWDVWWSFTTIGSFSLILCPITPVLLTRLPASDCHRCCFWWTIYSVLSMTGLIKCYFLQRWWILRWWNDKYTSIWGWSSCGVRVRVKAAWATVKVKRSSERVSAPLLLWEDGWLPKAKSLIPNPPGASRGPTGQI